MIYICILLILFIFTVITIQTKECFIDGVAICEDVRGDSGTWECREGYYVRKISVRNDDGGSYSLTTCCKPPAQPQSVGATAT